MHADDDRECILELLDELEGDEPDPQIGVTKQRLFIKGYRGDTMVVVHEVYTYIEFIVQCN